MAYIHGKKKRIVSIPLSAGKYLRETLPCGSVACGEGAYFDGP